MTNPVGYDVTSDAIIEDLRFFDSWEDRYRYIIDLGKQIPKMDDKLKTDDHLVPGCQSQVWMQACLKDEKLFFDVDSDAHIVRGLLAIVLSAYNKKTPEEILAFDIESFFAKVDLIKHLSPTRGNGLQAMVKKIQDIASNNVS